MGRIIFGDENAVKDQLLCDCFVKPMDVSERPILTGRWGVGKSAIFFHENYKLSELLEKSGEKDRLLWYIGENDLDLLALRNLQSKFGTDRERFTRALETMWKTRIIFTEAELLYKLREFYKSPMGVHWDYIAKIAKAQSATLPIWKRIPDVLSMVVGTDNGRVNAFKDIQDALEKTFINKALDNLQACLKDIENPRVQPTIVIEPIDTPKSTLGKEGSLAQSVVTALLNVYSSTFTQSKDQLIPLRIAIPWHRYRPELLDYPQRFYSYVGPIKWDSHSLRNFINRRIEWEFKRVERPKKTYIRGFDAWSILFEDYVINEHCKPKIREESFFYLLRHTHYRPRDLQRLVRMAVEKSAFLSRISVDDLLFGKDGIKVRSSAIRESPSEYCPLLMQIEFMPEVKRKFSSAVTNNIINLVSGIKVPFSVDDIKKRYQKNEGSGITPFKLNEIIDQLWTSGIIGIQVIPKSEQIADSFRQILGTPGFREYLAGVKKMYRWYFFEYNLEGKPTEFMRRYENEEELDIGLVLHPSTFEHLGPNVSTECPIGA
jgi:hypothetical protein